MKSKYILQPVQLNKMTRRTFSLFLPQSLFFILSLSLIHTHIHFLSLPFLCTSAFTEIGAVQGRIQVLRLFLCVFLFIFCFLNFFYVYKDATKLGSSSLHVLSPISFSFYYLLFLFYKNHSTAPTFISFKAHPFVRWAFY